MAFHWLDFLLITNLWDKTELLLTGSVKISTFSGKPTKVEFHVTVMSLDSINEGSMVSQGPDLSSNPTCTSDLRRGHLLRPVLGRPPPEAAGQHDVCLPAPPGGVARNVSVKCQIEDRHFWNANYFEWFLTDVFRGDLETGLFFQEREGCHISEDDHSQSLFVAVQEQENNVHGQVSTRPQLYTTYFTAVNAFFQNLSVNLWWFVSETQTFNTVFLFLLIALEAPKQTNIFSIQLLTRCIL